MSARNYSSGEDDPRLKIIRPYLKQCLETWKIRNEYSSPDATDIDTFKNPKPEKVKESPPETEQQTVFHIFPSSKEFEQTARVKSQNQNPDNQNIGSKQTVDQKEDFDINAYLWRCLENWNWEELHKPKPKLSKSRFDLPKDDNNNSAASQSGGQDKEHASTLVHLQAAPSAVQQAAAKEPKSSEVVQTQISG